MLMGTAQQLETACVLLRGEDSWKTLVVIHGVAGQVAMKQKLGKQVHCVPCLTSINAWYPLSSLH